MIFTNSCLSACAQMSRAALSPPPQPVSSYRAPPFPRVTAAVYNPLPREAERSTTSLPPSPQPISEMYQPTGRRNPSPGHRQSGPPPVLQVPYVTPPMELPRAAPQPAASGMFQPIPMPAAAPMPTPAPPPLLTVTDGQLSMMYIPNGTSFSTVPPGTRVVTDPDHPELHRGCFPSFEKETIMLSMAKLGRELNEKTLELNDKTKKYNELNGWYSSIKKEMRELDDDYQSLKKDVSQLRDKCADADDDAKHYRKECDSLSQQLKESKTYRKNLSDTVTRANADMRAAANRELMNTNVIRAKDSVIQQKDTEMKMMKQEMDSLKQQLLLLNEQLKSLKETADLASLAALEDSKVLEQSEKKIKELTEQAVSDLKKTEEERQTLASALENIRKIKEAHDQQMRDERAAATETTASPFPPSPSSPPSRSQPMGPVVSSSPPPALPQPRPIIPPTLPPSVPLSAPYPLVVAGPASPPPPPPVPSLPIPPSPPAVPVARVTTPIPETTAMAEKHGQADEPLQSMRDDALPVPSSADSNTTAPVTQQRTRRRRRSLYGPVRNKKKLVVPY